MPVLTARGAGVRQHRRWLFRDLDVSVEPGEVVAVVGPPGSGRTTLLLALAKRFRLAAGHVTVDGRAALGYVPSVTEPEAVFTVIEHVHEQLALFGRRHREAASVDLLGLDPHANGRDLSPYQKQLLGLVLARLERPAVIALDGLDESLDAHEQAALLTRLTEIAATGTAVLFTAREIDPSEVTTLIRLGAPTEPAPAESAPAESAPAVPAPGELPVLGEEPVPAGEPVPGREPADAGSVLAEGASVAGDDGEVEAERVGSVAGAAGRDRASGGGPIAVGGGAGGVPEKAAAEDRSAGGEKTKQADGEADADEPLEGER